MRPFLFILCAATLTASAVAFIANMPGVLIIPLAGWQAEISLALFLGIFILALLIFYLLILLLRLIFIAPQEQWRGWTFARRRSQRIRAEAGWVGALLVLTEDKDNQPALQAALAEAKRALPDTALTYLIRAAATQDIQNRQQIYKTMSEERNSETRLLGLLGLMYLARAKNENTAAAEFAAKAKAEKEKSSNNNEWLKHILPD